MYITEYLISEPVENLFFDGTEDVDQMRYEKHLRSVVAERNLSYPGNLDYSDWKYDYSHNCFFVDRCSTYTRPTKIAFYAVSQIDSSADCERDMVLWTYGAATVWVNGTKVVSCDTPQYKPIIMKPFRAAFRQGANEVFVAFQNLGVRDGRNIFALEIGDGDGLENTLPDIPLKAEYLAAEKFLDGVSIQYPVMRFPSGREDLRVGYTTPTSNWAERNAKPVFTSLPGICSWELPADRVHFVVEVKAGDRTLVRRFECQEASGGEYSDCRDFESNLKRILKWTASVEGQKRAKGKFGFFIANILARKALGIESPGDRELFFTTLQQMEDSYDCSDFLLSGVIRYLKNYEVDAELKARIEEVLFSYRYWMTMEGADAMCFWSDNHSLLFYSSAMIVGDMYPDAYFTKADMTGRELSLFGKKLTLQWLDDAEQFGSEEFNSTVYMNITFVCLLNIVDYAEPEIAARAEKVIDKILEHLMMHCFHGSIIAPMGRVYRGIVNPPKQGVQALVNLCDPSLPYAYGEGWLSYMATSSYKIPENIGRLAREGADMRYSEGNALIDIYKTGEVMLTSVQSPRLDGFRRWENVTLREDTDRFIGTNRWTRSFNERFHGTTCFRPGVYGYQQHMWEAALSGEAVLFTNHPGVPNDSMKMRPGYWFGNGVMPAVKQNRNEIGVVYDIPENHPIGWTHLFLPRCKYDEVVERGNWIFLRKGKGVAALWHSSALVPYDDVLCNTEMRSYQRKSAYYCRVDALENYASFEEFIQAADALKPSYEDGTLALGGKPFIRYEAEEDTTQYV